MKTRVLAPALYALILIVPQAATEQKKTIMLVTIEHIKDPIVRFMNQYTQQDWPVQPYRHVFGDTYSLDLDLPPGFWKLSATGKDGSSATIWSPTTTCCPISVILDTKSFLGQASAPGVSQAVATRGGATQLTATTAAEAITYAPSSDDTSPVMFWMVHTPNGLQFAEWLDHLPMDFEVMTPFMRLSSVASEAKRTFKEPPNVDSAALSSMNADGVSIVVSAHNFNGDSIENVVILRGSDIIRPTRSDVHVDTIANKLGASRTVKQGAFYFPVAAFEPSQPIMIVLAGSRANFEWVMTPDTLKTLR